jgi:hypothetical protein
MGDRMKEIRDENQLFEALKIGNLFLSGKYLVISYEITSTGISFLTTNQFSNPEDQRTFWLSLPTNSLLIVISPKSEHEYEIAMRGRTLKSVFEVKQSNKTEMISFEKLKDFVSIAPTEKATFKDFVEGLSAMNDEQFKNYPYHRGFRNQH